VKKLISIGFLLLGVLTGCVYDKYTPVEGCPEGENRYFMTFILNSPALPSTKADSDGMDIGLPGEELLVKKVSLYFYNGDGSLPSPVNRREITQFTQQVAGSQTADIANVVYDFAVELPFRPYVMLVAVNFDQNLQGLTLQEAREKVLESSSAWCGTPTTVSYGGGDVAVRPFRMTSSTYMNASGTERCELIIPGEYVWPTADDAKQHPMPVYVERLAAKVNVVQPTSGTSFQVPAVTQYPGIKTQVVILGWGLNAVNKSAYSFKKIDTGWSFNWSGVNWNEPAKYRCHWAKDANYDGGTYPHDAEALALAGASSCSLEYRKWSELSGNFSTEAQKTINPQYCLENTADGSILRISRSANELYPRMTHVLVKAKLSFAVGSGLPAAGDVAGYTTETDFYRYKGVFYTGNNIMAAVLADLVAEGAPLYKDNTRTAAADASDFTLTHTYGENLYPAVKSGVTLYDKAGAAVSADVLQNVKIDGFKDGQFYYKIPIEHLTAAPATPGSTYETAQYGVVRNHNYTVKVSDDLKGIGTGVWDVDEPIVPVTLDSDYVVSVHVTVSPWKEFTSRFLFVDPQGMLITDGQVLDRWEDGDNPHGNDWHGDGWYF